MPGHTQSTATQARLISWQEAVVLLEACDERGVPVPFSISFCTADESKGTGGEIITYPKAVRHLKNGRLRRSADFTATSAKGDDGKPHGFTRNIRAVDSDQVRRLDIHLILVINGHAVR